MNIRACCINCLAVLLCGCVSFPDAPAAIAPPVLAGNVIQSRDGALLGLQKWEAEEPKAIILAIHGMNDYSRAFALPAAWWAKHSGFTTYAIDQRGFGRSPGFGRWAGAETMKADLRASIEAIRAAHPDVPLFVISHSMGAAVVISAAAEAPLDVDGLVLAAPGVWGGKALPLPYRITANLGAALVPGKTMTGERAGRQATDNIEILREMWADPLVIKETRLDAVLGVIRVMGEAYGAADQACSDALILIGEKDEIIPRKAMEKAVSRYCGKTELRRYETGRHMLFRDLQGETVWRDVAAWIDARSMLRREPTP